MLEFSTALSMSSPLSPYLINKINKKEESKNRLAQETCQN